MYKPSALLIAYIFTLLKMINNITKYFAHKAVLNSKGPLSQISNVKLQYQQIASINKILTAFFKKFYILISKPIYTNTPTGIKISILYFLPQTNTKNKKKSKRLQQKLNALRQVRRNQKLQKALRFVRIQKAYWQKFLYNLNLLVSKNKITAAPRKFSRTRLTFLVLLLSKLLRTNVQLELVRLKYVYHDSNILAQFLGINSHRSTYGKFKNLLWRKVTTHPLHRGDVLETQSDIDKKNQTDGEQNSLLFASINDFAPVTQLTGFKIRISGRLARQRVVPKKTVKTTYKGAISPNKYNLVEEATFTGKNKKGAYSIRVWTSHGTTPNNKP